MRRIEAFFFHFYYFALSKTIREKKLLNKIVVFVLSIDIYQFFECSRFKKILIFIRRILIFFRFHCIALSITIREKEFLEIIVVCDHTTYKQSFLQILSKTQKNRTGCHIIIR